MNLYKEQMLKHGMEWKRHKYIRKEGNRYIYPEDLQNAANKVGERASQVANQIRKKAKEIYDDREIYGNAAREMASDYGKKAKDYGERAGRIARDYGEKTERLAKDYGEKAGNALEKGKKNFKENAERRKARAKKVESAGKKENTKYIVKRMLTPRFLRPAMEVQEDYIERKETKKKKASR